MAVYTNLFEGANLDHFFFFLEEAGRAEFNVATPTYATIAFSVR